MQIHMAKTRGQGLGLPAFCVIPFGDEGLRVASAPIKSKIPEQVPVLSLLKKIGLLPEPQNQFIQPFQTPCPSTGKNPSFPVTVHFIEPGHVINNPHPSHFAADSLQHPGRKSIFLTKVNQAAQEPVVCVFQFYEDAQEHLLMVFISRKQYYSKLIQALYPGNFVAVEIDFCAYHVFSPLPFWSK